MTHMLEDHRSPPFWKCFACRDSSVIFHDRELLLDRINELHPDLISDNNLSTLVDICQQSDPLIIKECPICSWADGWALREHLWDEHGSMADPDEPIYWECLACRECQTFDDKEDLERHESEFHGHSPARPRSPTPGDEAGPSTTTLGPPTHQRWQCKSCQSPAFFVDKDGLQDHVNNVHPGMDAEDRFPMFVEMCGVSNDSASKSCPFCAWIEDTGAMQQQSPLLDHIAHHIHLFSLHALPWASEQNKEPDASQQWEQFGEGEYFADEDDASQRAQLDGNVDTGRQGDDILEHMREVMAERSDADAGPRMVKLQLYNNGDVAGPLHTESSVLEVHVDCFIQGTYEPVALPASLVVFRFHFRDDLAWRSYKEVRTTVHFESKGSFDRDPQVIILWPMGSYIGRRPAGSNKAAGLAGKSAGASTYIGEGKTSSALLGGVLVSRNETASAISLATGTNEMSDLGVATEFHAIVLLRWAGVSEFEAEVGVEATIASSGHTERHWSRVSGSGLIPFNMERQTPVSLAPFAADLAEKLDPNNLLAAFRDIVRVLEMEWRHSW